MRASSGSILRHALEGMDEVKDNDDQSVVMKGSLSGVYTQALAIAYAKDQPAEADKEVSPTAADGTPALESVALETQQMDVEIVRKLAAAISPATAAPTSTSQTVYGVSKDDINTDVVIDVATELNNNQSNDASPSGNQFILIIDGTTPSVNGSTGGLTERGTMLTSALESLVSAHGGKVYHSFTEYVQAR